MATSVALLGLVETLSGCSINTEIEGNRNRSDEVLSGKVTEPTQEQLAETVLTDPGINTRRAALEKITDQNCLLRIVLYPTVEKGLQLDAIEKITDQVILLKIIFDLNQRSTVINNIALNKLRYSELWEIILDPQLTDDYFKLQTLKLLIDHGGIENQELLKKIVRSDGKGHYFGARQEMRAKAVELITDLPFLERMKSDDSIRMIIERRIDELKLKSKPYESE